MDANIAIINDLKQFIQRSGSSEELRNLFTTCPADFSRQRKLGFERLVLLLINFFKKSYAIEITEFYRVLSDEDSTVTKSAFCQQRMKINEIFFICLNEILVQSFYRHYASEIKRWKGLRVIAVDGTTVSLFHKQEVISHFGAHRNQNKKKKISPMGKAVSAFDVLNKITLKSDLYPFTTSETKIAQRWLPYYEPDMLLIYDRGYVGFNTMFLHQSKESPQPFLIRCPVRFTHEVLLLKAGAQMLLCLSGQANILQTYYLNTDLLCRQNPRLISV